MTGREPKNLLLLPAALLLCLSTPSSAQQACFDTQIACNDSCLAAPSFDTQMRCICQCGFSACECALGGTQSSSACIDAIAAICGGNFTGLLQSTPVLPDRTIAGGFEFDDVVSGMWSDPPFTEGFDYTMTGQSLFTAIQDFPSGFSQGFVVSVDDQILGTFQAGQSADLASFPGGGVSSFRVTGILPLVDAADPEAFPLRLSFDTPTADFTMTAVPDPGPALGGIAAVMALGWRRTRFGALKQRHTLVRILLPSWIACEYRPTLHRVAPQGESRCETCFW